MKDLYEREQEVLERALRYLESVDQNESCDREAFAKLLKEYERLLKLLKRVTWVTDKTTVELNADKMKLLDKVQYDGLTGIYNRQYFEEEMPAVLKDCTEQQLALGLLMLDVDFFKLYNDTYGHGAGDECLRKIARTLEASLPKNAGFVARYGGEEFVIVLPGADAEQIQMIAEEILDNVKALKLPHEKNEERGCVTISIGGASISRIVEEDKEAYLNCADAALYQSKQTGRDRLTLHFFKEDKQ